MDLIILESGPFITRYSGPGFLCEGGSSEPILNPPGYGPLQGKSPSPLFAYIPITFRIHACIATTIILPAQSTGLANQLKHCLLMHLYIYACMHINTEFGVRSRVKYSQQLPSFDSCCIATRPPRTAVRLTSLV